MWRSLWQTPAALTRIRTCVPEGCGVGSSISASGALNSATLKLFIVSLPLFLIALAIFLGQTLPCLHRRDKSGRFNATRATVGGFGSPRLAHGVDRDDLRRHVGAHIRRRLPIVVEKSSAGMRSRPFVKLPSS